MATPVLYVDDIVVGEADDFATFVLRLSQPSASLTSVRYSTSRGTARDGNPSDYLGASDTVNFAPGETVKLVNVPIINDTLVEGPETFWLVLSNATGLTLSDGLAIATIVDNDTIASAPLVSVNDAIVNESDSNVAFSIRLDRAATALITVTYQTMDGSALSGNDYASVTSSVTFLPGETAKTILVPLIDDSLVEANETFGFQLTGATGGAVLADTQGTAIIEHNDGVIAVRPMLTVDDVVVGESDDFATFVLRLSQPSASLTSVRYSTSPGTARDGNPSDYLGPSDTVNFAPGETVKLVNVPIINDTLVEGPETFWLVLTNATGLTLSDGLAIATIVDNDTIASAPLVSVSDAIVNESDGNVAFTIRLDRAATALIAVTYQTMDGSAVSGNDYASVTSSVTFLPGETAKTILVPLIDDSLVEADETFGFQLTGATGGAILADAQGTAIIEHNDGVIAVRPILTVDDIIEGEGEGVRIATFVLRLSQSSASLTSVEYSTSPGTARAGNPSDYLGPSDTVYFAPGETVKLVNIPIIDDTVVENPETFFLNLSNATGLTLSRSFAIATIVDNDADSLVLVAGIDSLKAEGQGGSTAMTFSVALKQPLSTSQSVNWLVAGIGNHPASAADFAGGAFPSGSVTFAPGETRKVVTVNVAGDTTLEGDETFVLTVIDPSGVLGTGTVQALGTILDDDALAASIAATTISAPEGNTGSAQFTFVLNLNRAATTTQSIGWVVAGSGARPADATDFVGGVLPSGTVTFAPGETSKSITVAIAGDTLVEPDESFALAISNVTSDLVIGSPVSAATILNDDAVGASIAALSAVRVEGQSGATPFTFVVSLDRAATSTATLSWAVAGTGANPAGAADFAGGTLPAGTVTFAAGETAKTITVDIGSDTVREADEGFLVTLSAPTSGLVIVTASAGGTILNDDGVVSIAAAGAVRAEGSAGGTAFTFTVTHSGDPSVSHSVSYGVIGAGANPAAGADFVGGFLPGGTVTFAAGETSRIITVSVEGDGMPEADEGFTVALSNPSPGLVLGTGSASAPGTILNDDAAISVAPASAVQAEGDAGVTHFTFTVTLTGDATVPHSVSYAVTGSGANPAAAADFVGGALPGGTVSFGVGETSRTITVDVAGDIVVEPDEGFTVTLSNPSTGVALGTASAAGTIVGDDATLSIAALSAVKGEGQAGTTAFTFTATRTGGTSVIQSVSWGVTGSGTSQAVASDFAGGVLPSGTVTFAAGETSKTITVNVAGYSTVESDESFLVTLSNPSSGLSIGTGTASGTILNDDTAPPVATHGDAYIVLQGQSLSIAAAAGVLLNDQSASTASLLSGPSHGALQLAATGGFGFTPAAGFSGIDSFTYHATNNGSTSANDEALLYVVPVQVGQATTLNLLALNAEEQIASTYAAFFGRGADAGGFGFWVGEFNRLLPTQGPAPLFANIASSFGISAEAKTLYPFLANPFGASDSQISAFLDSVYNNLFNRRRTPAGWPTGPGRSSRRCRPGSSWARC